MNQSAELTAFYVAYLAWALRGAPQCEPFSRNEGLCFNVRNSVDSTKAAMSLYDEMVRQFREARLHLDRPFNDSEWNYKQELREGRAHFNERRLAWVRERVAKG